MDVHGLNGAVPLAVRAPRNTMRSIDTVKKHSIQRSSAPLAAPVRSLDLSPPTSRSE